jgi:hypothetical protein
MNPTTFLTDLLELLFQNTALALIGDASGLQPSATAGVFWISLHTADPGATGAQNTSECTYTGYGRVSVARSAAGWTVSGVNVSNAAVVEFGACSAGSETATYFGIGTDETAAGNLIRKGALTAGLAISAGITPRFAIGALNVDAA